MGRASWKTPLSFGGAWGPHIASWLFDACFVAQAELSPASMENAWELNHGDLS
jgi:hypothetical protein